MIIDAGPFIIDGKNPNSRLWALVKRAIERGTSDVVDAHLAVIAQRLGTFILTTDGSDMSRLSARFENY